MPTVLVGFSKSLHGKLILIILTIIITYYNITGGILMAMLIIFLEEFNYEHNNNNPIIYEGFEGETISNIGFRSNHCKIKSLVDEDGDKVNEEDIGTVFPEIKFKSTKCNPCDDSCAFSISDGKEQMQTAELLKPKDSKKINVVKHKA
jgi:hypothetical protein